jgi:hypothetical protein
MKMNRTQQTMHQRLAARGWLLAERMKNDSTPTEEACRYEAMGNVAVVYPDGSMDRLSGTMKKLKFRSGWYSPTARAAADELADAQRREMVRASMHPIPTDGFRNVIRTLLCA